MRVTGTRHVLLAVALLALSLPIPSASAAAKGQPGDGDTSSSTLPPSGAGVAAAASSPLTVHVGTDLSCQIEVAGDTSFEMFPPTAIPADCGTLVVVDGVLYGPDFGSHAGTATSFPSGIVPFSPISQTSGGSGTAGDPYTITTVVEVVRSDTTTTGIVITETDTYVDGASSYRTDLSFSHTGAESHSLVLYRAGDCYLADDDHGVGIASGGGSVGCRNTVGGAPGPRTEEWVPLTAGSHYYEASYRDLWSWIDSHASFPDTCECDIDQDNGAGLSWEFPLEGNDTDTFAHETRFGGNLVENCDGINAGDVRGPDPNLASGRALSSFPNDDAVCDAVWVPGLDDGFIPQGLHVLPGRTALVSGYVNEIRSTLRLLHVGLDNGEVIQGPLDFANGGHGGGVSIDESGRVWVASTGKLLFWSSLDSLFAGGTPSKVTRSNRDGAFDFSYIAQANGPNLWVGSYDTSELLQFPLSTLERKRTISKSNATTIISTATKAQGGAFHDPNLWISSSTSRCGAINVGLSTRDRNGFAPGVEEIEFDANGFLWMISEAGSVRFPAKFFPVIARVDSSKITDDALFTCSAGL